MNDGSRLGEIVRARRLGLQLGQDALAELAGMSLRGLRDIESGRVSRPRPESLRRLAAALHVTPGFFVEAMHPRSMDVQPLRITVLGPLAIRRGNATLNAGSSNQRWLLGLLALQANHVVSFDEIVDQIWGPDPPATCRGMVQTYITRLRRVLVGGPDAPRIQRSSGGYVLEVGVDQLDALAFEQIVATVHAGREAHDDDRMEELLCRGLDLWYGPVLAGSDGPMGQHPAAIALSRRRVELSARFAELAMRDRRHRQAIDRLRVVAHAEPLDERVHALLMRALAGAGRRADAIAVFGALRARLVEQLGIEPGADVRRLHLEILTDSASGHGRLDRAATTLLEQTAAEHHARGMTMTSAGDPRGAVIECLRSATVYRSAGDLRRAALSVLSAGMSAHAAGDFTSAIAHCGRALAELERLGESWSAAYAARALAAARARVGRAGEMRARLHAALAVCAEHVDGFGQALILDTLGDIARADGDLEAARRYRDRATCWWASLALPPDHPRPSFHAEGHLESVALAE